ncbi:hypothetical protein H0H92_004728, partial [Tricholoma furcatifolium]
MSNEHTLRRSRTLINIPHNASNLLKVRDGICMMGENNAATLHYFTLPSTPEDFLSWSRIDLGTQFKIIDFDFAFRDNDLLVVATTRPNNTSSGAKVEIHLIQLSTRKQHALAHKPVVSLPDIEDSEYVDLQMSGEYIDLQIAGEYIAIATSRNTGSEFGCLTVMNWKTSVVHMVPISKRLSSGLMNPTDNDTILLPNTIDATLDIYPVSNQDSWPDPILRLSLPESDYRELFLTFQSSNPSSPTSNSSAHDTILLINMDVILSLDQITDSFCIFVHRSALVKLYEATLKSHVYGETLEWEAWGPAVTRWFRGSTTGKEQWATNGLSCALMKAESGELTILDFEKKEFSQDEDTVSLRIDDDEGLAVHAMEDCFQASSFEGVVKHSLPYTSRSQYLDSGLVKPRLLFDEGRLIRVGTQTGNIGGLIEITMADTGSVAASYVRMTSFILRAILAGPAGNNVGLLIGDLVLFNIGFFSLLYSAYNLVLDRYIISTSE